MFAICLVAGCVAADNQPSAESQHGHRAAQRQQIGGVVHFEANGLFERSDNQANNNHFGQIVFQALQSVYRENVGVLLCTTPKAWIKV